MFLSEWCEFPSAPCLAGKKKFMTARVLMLLKSRASLTCFWACFLPGRAKDLSAPRYFHYLQVLFNLISPSFLWSSLFLIPSILAVTVLLGILLLFILATHPYHLMLGSCNELFDCKTVCKCFKIKYVACQILHILNTRIKSCVRLNLHVSVHVCSSLQFKCSHPYTENGKP